MKKPTKPTQSKPARTTRRSRVPVSPCPRVPSPSSTAPGILSVDVVKGKGGVEVVVVRLAPHHLVVVTGGRKPTVSLLYSHHGITFDSFELNGKFEKVIDHIRAKFPELRVD